jgi:hypothetical protein
MSEAERIERETEREKKGIGNEDECSEGRRK